MLTLVAFRRLVFWAATLIAIAFFSILAANKVARESLRSSYGTQKMDIAIHGMCNDRRIEIVNIYTPTGNYKNFLGDGGPVGTKECHNPHKVTVSESENPEVTVVIQNNFTKNGVVFRLPFSFLNTHITFSYDNGGEKVIDSKIETISPL